MEFFVYFFLLINYYELMEVEIFILFYGIDYKLKMVNLNGEEIVVFNVEGEDFLCFL